jgi:ribosomal 50S subunit-recycling heat shock protein
MAKRPPLELIPEAEFIKTTEVTQESSDTGHVTVNVLSVQPSKPPQKRKSKRLNDFDR